MEAFRYLDRFSLDAVQFSTTQFRQLAEQLNNVCLRRIKHAGISGRSFHWDGQYTLRVTASTVPERELASTETEDYAGVCFGRMVSHCYVEKMGVLGVPLTDALFLPMQVRFSTSRFIPVLIALQGSLFIMMVALAVSQNCQSRLRPVSLLELVRIEHQCPQEHPTLIRFDNRQQLCRR